MSVLTIGAQEIYNTENSVTILEARDRNFSGIPVELDGDVAPT